MPTTGVAIVDSSLRDVLMCRFDAWDADPGLGAPTQAAGGEDFAQLLAEAEHHYGQAYYRHLAMRQQDEDEVMAAGLSGAAVAKAEKVKQSSTLE